jgi:protein-disulfide isomerase/uncharacterized membrane protein
VVAKKKKKNAARGPSNQGEAQKNQSEQTPAAQTGKADKASAPPPPPDPGLARTWPVFAMAVVLLVGMVIALNLTWHHEQQIYGEQGVELVGCKEGSAFDCDKVNTSDWSEVPGWIPVLKGSPVALMAIPTYVLLLFLGVWGLVRNERRALSYAFGISVLTVLHSLYLFYISKAQLDTFCPWCMSLYTVNLLTMGFSWAAAGGSPVGQITDSLKDLGAWPHTMRLAGIVFVATLLVSVGAQKQYRKGLGGGITIEKAEGVTDVSNADPEGTLAPRTVPMNIRITKNDDGTPMVPPKDVVVDLPIGPGDAWKGNPDAELVLVEFADLECGYCKRLASELKRVYEGYGDRILFVFKHFPMHPQCNPGVKNPRHRYACSAAHAAECAKDQGRFWAFHDLAFKNSHKLDPESLRSYAETVGLDTARFDSCMSDSDVRQRVVAHGRLGAELDISGTPRLFIGNELWRGARTAEAVAQQIEVSLGADPIAAREKAAAMRNAVSRVCAIPPDTPDMRELEYGSMHFFIDTFEAALSNGEAVSAQGQVPSTGTSWFDAKEACEAAGKRMCTEKEWTAACQGAMPVDDDGDGSFADDMIEGTAYPYSDFHRPNACWDAKNRETQRPVHTGNMPACVSADGVFDLTGNVEEWVGATAKEAVLLGGAFDTRDDKARCFRLNDTFGAGHGAYRNGFRCCKDAP